MKINLLRSGWLQYNVHYYDRIKFKYGNDDEASEQALEQLKEQAVESVPRELESFMFTNKLYPNKQAIRGDVNQQSLHSILSIMDEMNQELTESAIKDESITREMVMKFIDQRKLCDWSVEMVKKIASG